MSNKNRNQGVQNAAGKGNGQEELTPKEKHARWKDDKIAKAGQDDFNVISQKTRDSAAFVNLINFNDQLMYQLRMNVGINPRVTSKLFDAFMERSKEAKEMINTMNAELCQALGRNYIPPRGFQHPLKQSQLAAGPAVRKEPKAAQKATISQLPVGTQESAEKTISDSVATDQEFAPAKTAAI